ncbi:hypothetical protein BVAVS116_K0025 (plasmid) [Borreliella valaisiana VS116]|uniref:Uncharacterized protein n=1 Tax=Borreliella valaisiana VS116 TaxID=445987 RepID=C0R8L8_BORVA|nr:hypothetical protein BVAVS116_K0025 [Borreliella valaisiana VS116]
MPSFNLVLKLLLIPLNFPNNFSNSMSKSSYQGLYLVLMLFANKLKSFLFLIIYVFKTSSGY